jgi:hypothetical protein
MTNPMLVWHANMSTVIFPGRLQQMTIIKLSPSDLTFLWDECKRCFYLKIINKYARPSTPMPAIFTKIDGLMKNYFEGRSTAEFTHDLPPGVIQHGDRSVSSQPIKLPGHSLECYITGRLDTLVKFEDGSYGVVDFKTSTPKPTHVTFYGRQLHGYMYALENPAPGKLFISPVTKLGLLVVEPMAMDRTRDGRIGYFGSVTYQEVPRDDSTFLGFLGEVLTVLEQPDPPSPADNCQWCHYREVARSNHM